MVPSSSARLNIYCSFHPPSLNSWIYALSIHGVCCGFVALPIAVVLWRCRRIRPELLPTISLCLGTGTAALILIGTLYLRASYSIPWIGPFLASTVGFGTFFKCCNIARIGNPPEGADSSLVAWLLWFVLLPEPIFVKGKIQEATKKEMYSRLTIAIAKVAGLTVLVSALQAPLIATYMLQLPFLLRATIYGYLHVWLIYLFASFCLDTSCILAFLLPGKAVQLQAGFAHPLWMSRSFREAWGSRWNRAVQQLLQRTVYAPLRASGYSRLQAALLTFGASGLLHEYNFAVHNTVGYRPGVALLFFVGVGSLMLMERSRVIPEWVPTPVVSTFYTLAIAIPVELLFIESWLKAGVVDAIAELMPTIRCEWD